MTAFNIDAFQSTNFEFDIEANRRRRAELANDVTELINISKFFLEHYSSDPVGDLPSLPPTTIAKNPTKSITKREKNEANVSKLRGRLCSNAPTKKCLVTNVTPPHVKRKQTRMNNRTTHRTMCRNDDDVPPLFDKVKLHEYCVDIVDRFFHGPPPNGSDFSESPKEKPTPKKYPSIERTEKSVQTTTNAHSANETGIVMGTGTGATKPKKNPKYALVSSRYLSPAPKKFTNETLVKRNASPFRLVSAKSQEILNEVARKGTEIKRHSCLIHKKAKSVEYRDFSASQPDVCGSHLRFQDIHPSIELVPSNSIFPKRILKLTAESSKNSSPTEKGCSISSICNQTTDQDINEVQAVTNTDEVGLDNNKPETNINNCDPRDVQEKGELQLQQLPVLTIKPKPKCGIENVFEIDIKPSEGKSEPLFGESKNKVFEVVYKPPDMEIEKKTDKENGTPFPEEHRASETFSAENRTTDENHATSNLSITMSTSSHLTDDEKFQSDHRIQPAKTTTTTHVLKTPARSVIDRILEVEGIPESTEEAAPAIQNIDIYEKQPSTSNHTENFDDLRELLRRIRNDKTTLDVALEDISEPPDFMSPSRHMIDREVQCCESSNLLDTPKSTGNPDNIRDSTNRATSIRCSSQCVDTSVLESPKFNKTIESIRSSARKLDFNTIGNEYRTATRQQIEKAAKKFLKSILRNADMPQSASEYENSSRIDLRTERQKYHIVDDQIIQSNFNMKSDHSDCTSSISNDVTSLQLRMPSARHLCNRSTDHCNNWINQNDSEFTTNSIENYINNYKLNGKRTKPKQQQNVNHTQSDLSDGEILSDGEFYLP